MNKFTHFSLFLILIPAFAHSQERNINYYLNQGFKFNPTLQDYRNQVLINHSDSELLVAKQKPYFEGIGQFMYAPVLGNLGYDGAVTNGGLFQTQLKVSQPILNRKIRIDDYARLGIQGKSIQNSMALSALQLKHDITAQYILSCADYDMNSFNKETLKFLQTEKDILKQLVEKGVQPQASFLSFLLEIQALERQVIETEIQYNKDIAELNSICGIHDTGLVSLNEPSLLVETEFKSGENPFLKQYYLDSLKIENSRLIMENHYKAAVNWFADAGFLSSQFSNIPRNAGLSFGLNIGIPIFDWHQKKIQEQQYTLQQDTRVHYRDYFFQQRSQDLLKIRNELAEIEKSYKLFSSQKIQTSQMVQSAHQMLDAGTMNVTDFLLMLRNYRELAFSLNQVKYRKLQLINELNYFHW